MNPRLFCRERSYHKALLLTYSFDPIFFEQVVLPDLWAGGSSDILVLGDTKQIDMATQAAIDQLYHLGRHYLLAGANHVGSFHPKVLLRLGTSDGIVMLGSGNLTSSGWGGNQELGTAWMVGPGHNDKGEWLHPFLDDVLSWCSNEIEMDALRRMKDIPWLSLTSSALPEFRPILYSRQNHSLSHSLEQRFTGRQFDEVKILTGSTDESGAFLRWAHTTFGIKRATIVLTPTMVSFLPDKLADLPIDLRLIAAPSDRPLHAKFYWFDGPDGPAAVMGSANCSAAAWLLPPDRLGNIETAVVYDAPNAEEYGSVLALFDSPSQAPDALLSPKKINVIEQPDGRLKYQLTSFRWDHANRTLHAIIRPEPPIGSTAELVFCGKQLTMMRSLSLGDHWECELPDGIGSVAVFASVQISQGDKSWVTPPHWIDDLMALEHASHAARFLEPFKGLDSSASSAEQRQMLDELQEVAHALFNDTSTFRDPGVGSGYKEKTTDDTPSEPVDPNDLICHLEESEDTLQHITSSRPGTLSLTGILRLLFDADSDNGGTAAVQEPDGGQMPKGPGKPSGNQKPNREPTQQEPALIEKRFRERLESQISIFFTKMSSSSFSERCTATQMVQAISFPLAVALRGQKRGWASADTAEKWALEVFSLLFRNKGQGSGGLLHAVEQRYVQNEHGSTFNEVVGDGTLWIVLVATLGNARWQGIGTEIDKAVALREVFSAPQLLASANPNDVAFHLGKIKIKDAKSYLAKIAPKVTQLLIKIENLLDPVWEAEIYSQAARSIIHKVGDLLWRENVGWAVCLAESYTTKGQSIQVRLRGVEKRVMDGYYVNVTDLASRNPDLATLIKDLWTAVSRPS